MPEPFLGMIEQQRNTFPLGHHHLKGLGHRPVDGAGVDGHSDPFGQRSALHPRLAGIGHGLVDPGTEHLGKPVAGQNQPSQARRGQPLTVDLGQYLRHAGAHFGLGMKEHQHCRLAHRRVVDLQQQPAEIDLDLDVPHGHRLQNDF